MTNLVTDRNPATSIEETDQFYVIDANAGADWRASLSLLRLELLGQDAAVTVAAADRVYILDTSASPQVMGYTTAQAIADLRTLAATDISAENTVTAVGADYVLILDTSTSPHSLAKALISDLLDNATHTGDVAGATVLTLQAAAISAKAEVTAIGTDYVLILDTSVSPHALKKALASDFAGSISASTISGQVTATAVGGDYLLILDTSDSPNALKKALVSDVLDNATHTGEVSGSAALTVQPAAISNRGSVTMAAGDQLLILDVSDSPNALKRISASDFAAASHNHTASQVTDFDTEVENNTAVTLNTAKVTNATHTGEVTGSGALTVQPAAISNRSSVSVAAGDQLLILDVSDSPNALKRISASDFATSGQANAAHTGDASGATALTLQASAISGRTEAVSVGTDYLLFLDVSDSPNALKKDAVQDVVNLAKPIENQGLACSDETTALTTGRKTTFRAPYGLSLSEVRANVTTAPVGSSIIVDIRKKVGNPSPDVATSILSTLLYIDAGEYTSEDASASPAHQSVISDATAPDDCQYQVWVTQVGASTAGAGLKVELIWRQT